MPKFYWVHLVFANGSRAWVLPRGVVKILSKILLEKSDSFFASRKKLQMSPWLGMEPCFHLSFSILEPPSGLNLWILVCIATVSVSSCVHQSCYIWNTLVFWWFVSLSFCFLFQKAPWTLRQGFHEAIPFRTAITKSHTLSCCESLYSISLKKGFHWWRLFETLIFRYSSMSSRVILSLGSFSRIIVSGFCLGHDLS